MDTFDNNHKIKSIGDYLTRVKDDMTHWSLPFGCAPWFRGQSDITKPPIPGILRGDMHNLEEAIVNRFRAHAPMFGSTPERNAKDEWLYFMQHAGLPTRLLDWSEGALIGLYFAVQNSKGDVDPGVWMLHPLEMNCRTLGKPIFPAPDHHAFITRCDLAYGITTDAPMDSLWPIAIVPTHVHPRMRSQKGCFTIHGSRMDDFEEIARELKLRQHGFFRKYCICRHEAPSILKDLRLSGITHCALFGDYDALATEMKRVFTPTQEPVGCPYK